MAFLETSEPDETLDIPASMLPPRTENLYALRVKGQSMIEDLIDDGDVVLFQRRETASPGDMVAAWIKQPGEATLKRYYPEGARVRLQAGQQRDVAHLPGTRTTWRCRAWWSASIRMYK